MATPAKKFRFESSIFDTKYGNIKYSKGTYDTKRFLLVSNVNSNEEVKPIMLFGRDMKTLVLLMEEAVEECKKKPASDTPDEPDEYLYRRILKEYGKEIKMQTVLEVKRYRGRNYIMLRRYFLSTTEDSQSGDYKPCRGGYRFSESDDFEALARYVQRMIDTDKK